MPELPNKPKEPILFAAVPFKGYTENLGMQFIDAEGNRINGTDVQTNYKHLDMWSK